MFRPAALPNHSRMMRCIASTNPTPAFAEAGHVALRAEGQAELPRRVRAVSKPARWRFMKQRDRAVRAGYERSRGDLRMAVDDATGLLAALLLAGCVLAPVPASGATSGPAPGPAPPNFLWIVAEDHGPHHGSYADPYAFTPNLDRLAAEGARFTRAFATAPICTPARSAIITGMYPTSIGSHHMWSVTVPPPHVKGFPEWLRAAGYFTTNKGKTDYNFSPWLPTDFRRAVRDAPLGVWDQNGRHAHWRNRAPGQPFFSVFNITTTHGGKLIQPDLFAKVTAGLAPAARHDPAAAPLPPYYPDTPAVRRDVARYYDLVSVLDARVGAILAELEADGLADDTVVFFYGDHGWGLPRGKHWLYDSGLRVPLLVRWPGRIAPGTVREDPVGFVDFAPTLLALAGAPVPAHLQGRVFLGGDAAPAPEYLFFARDRTSEGSDHIRAVRGHRYKYIRNFAPELPYVQHPPGAYRIPTMQVWRRRAAAGALEGAQRQFMAQTKPPEELYDTEADPHEVVNLAGDPAHAGRLVRMRTALDRWIESTGDLGAVPEAELERRFRPDGVYQRAARPRASPPGGTFHRPTAVALTCPTEGATIEYTTELGKAPRWKLYTGPLRLRAGELRELRFRCGRLGYFDSEIVRYSWWDRAARVPRPTGDR